MFDTIDFKGCVILENEYIQENLFQLKCKNGRRIVIHYQIKGTEFGISVYQDDNCTKRCYGIDQILKSKHVEYYLQKIIDFESAIFSEAVQKIIDQISYNIDNCSDQFRLNETVELLTKLEKMGLSQVQVGDYFDIYALKYYDDEELWNFTCDLLDRIRGFCASQLRIWK